jgi:hypothetical protein
MKIIHLNGFSEEEKKSFKEIIHSNVISSMKALLEAAQRFKYEVADSNKVKESIHSVSWICAVNPQSQTFWYSPRPNV